MSNAYLFRAGQCNETAGFLFSHPCDEPSAHVCGECQKPVCAKHVADTNGTLRCTTCAKRWWKTSGTTNSSAHAGYDPYYGGPYFYSWHIYGSSASGHHFQDSDEGSLRGREPNREDLDGFENDMGAS